MYVFKFDVHTFPIFLYFYLSYHCRGSWIVLTVCKKMRMAALELDAVATGKSSEFLDAFHWSAPASGDSEQGIVPRFQVPCSYPLQCWKSERDDVMERRSDPCGPSGKVQGVPYWGGPYWREKPWGYSLFCPLLFWRVDIFSMCVDRFYSPVEHKSQIKHLHHILN